MDPTKRQESNSHDEDNSEPRFVDDQERRRAGCPMPRLFDHSQGFSVSLEALGERQTRIQTSNDWSAP